MHLSRRTYDPKIGSDGKPKIVELGQLDDVRFLALAPYDYLTADYIAALSGTNTKAVTHRFNDLKRAPGRWIDMAEPYLNNWKYYRNDSIPYCLSPKAEQRLLDRGHQIIRYGFTGPFVHKLMAQWIRASFEIATKAERVGALIIPFHDIISNVNTPEITRTETGDHKHQISVRFHNGEKQVTRRVTPDTHPFALKTDEYALLLLEADCNSEDTASKSGNDLDLKFRQYLAIFEQDVIRQRYGFRKAYMLFVTTSLRHMQHAMTHLAELTAHKPSLRRRFLFKRHPSLKSDDKPVANGHMLTEPWKRAELPDFSLLAGEVA